MGEQHVAVSVSGHVARVRAHRVALCAELDAVRRRAAQMRADDRARRQRMRSMSRYRDPGASTATTGSDPCRPSEGFSSAMAT